MSNYFAALDDSAFVPVVRQRKCKDYVQMKQNTGLVVPVVDHAIVANLTAFTKACESGASWGDIMLDLQPVQPVQPVKNTSTTTSSPVTKADSLPGRWRRARDNLYPHLASTTVAAPVAAPVDSPSWHRWQEPVIKSRWDVPPAASPAAIQQLIPLYHKFPIYLQHVGLFVLDLLLPSYLPNVDLPDYCANLLVDAVDCAQAARPVVHFFNALWHAVAPRSTCSPAVRNQVYHALRAGFDAAANMPQLCDV
jgi:hypothetical protein